MEIVVIDSLVVPEESKERFLQRVHQTAEVLKKVPGFVEGYVHEKKSGESDVNIVTAAVWKDVEHFPRSQLSLAYLPNQQIEAAARLIRRSSGRVSIDLLARHVETSHSTLERRFRAEVGATPKTLSRLARLQNVCRLWDTGKPLTEIAYQAGFSDQPHLIHDFKHFTGIAPEAFLSKRAPRNPPTFYK
jgi:AraC-like DNA-binding protein